MRILVLGGTRFIGPRVVDMLVAAGHEVTLFHRGVSSPKKRKDVGHIIGDRKQIRDHAAALQAVQADVVVDMIAMTANDAKNAMSVLRGHAGRIVTISSGDVYRAFGRVIGAEPGPIEIAPLTEMSPLRITRYPYPDRQPRYDKILVEVNVIGDAQLPSTILRLPMVYGQGDYQHRFFQYIKRMDDRRPFILLEQALAGWRFARAHVDNVAHAVKLAVEDPRAAGQIYNVAEPTAPRVAESVAAIGRVLRWRGQIRFLPNDRCPPHLRSEGNFGQHIVYDTTRIREELGYREIIQRDQALALTILWERENPPDIDPRQFDYAAEDAALAAARPVRR